MKSLKLHGVALHSATGNQAGFIIILGLKILIVYFDCKEGLKSSGSLFQTCLLFHLKLVLGADLKQEAKLMLMERFWQCKF
ncbi:hypothetical protein A1507_14035 [Methylomonas koyamae]|uniref:Uncharacterized protein n=1 Tax=Methylomonas koyamae TaxID=702114 RepID=A0A177NDN3_9GAMM|nr:hypothetical protein A1507_14035 [Methylomonas koyamae]OAI27205.1 hypothetical protein A1356_10000 [Methylomonas koyamae]